MKKRIRYRIVSLVVVFCLVAAVFPLFVLPSFAADPSKINIFSLDWSFSCYPALDVDKDTVVTSELLPGSPITVKFSVDRKCTLDLKFVLGEPLFLSESQYDMYYFINPVAYSNAASFTPNAYLKSGKSGNISNGRTSGSASAGFRTHFNVTEVHRGASPDASVIVQLDISGAGVYYLTLLSLDKSEDVYRIDDSAFDLATHFYVNSSHYKRLSGSYCIFDMFEYGNHANNPQYERIQDGTHLKLFGGLDYNFFDCSLDLFFADDKAPGWLTSYPAYGAYLYFDVSIELPGTLMYIDVYDGSVSKSVPFQLCYYATDTVQNVDTIAGTVSQQLSGQTLVPIGGSIAGGLVAVQPTGSANVNYVLSTNYNADGTTGNLDYDVDYGYRDTTYLDTTTYQYDATSSFLSGSRLNLLFKAPASSFKDNCLSIKFVCMDNCYVNYDRTFSQAGILQYNTGERYINYHCEVSSDIDNSFVSLDTEYLANRLDKSTDEVLAFLQRFYPSSKSIVEFNSALADLDKSRSQVDAYEFELRDSVSSGMEKLPTFSSSTSNYVDAMIFVSTFVQNVAKRIEGFSGIFIIPILIGLFFFILQRASGVTRVGRSIHDKFDKGKGGDSS